MRALGQALFFVVLVTPFAGAAFAGDLHSDGAFVSTRTDGPPLVVSSPGLATGLHADTLDGLEGASLPRSPANVITVAETGADFSSVEAAVDSITDASPANPYLVVVGPGIFPLDSGLLIPSGVHLRGSGVGQTILRAVGGNLVILHFSGVSSLQALAVEGPIDKRAINADNQDRVALLDVALKADGIVMDLQDSARVTGERVLVESESTGAILRGTAQLELDDAVVVLTSGDFQLTGFDVDYDATLTLRRSSIRILEGDFDEAYAVTTGRSGSSVTLEGTRIEIEPTSQTTNINDVIGVAGLGSIDLRGGEISIQADDASGVYSSSSTITVSHSQITMEGAGSSPAMVVLGDVRVFHSRLSGSVYTADGATTRVIHSQLDGTTSGPGTITCRWVTDENFGTFPTSCP